MFQYDKIVAVAFMIAEEDVLAVGGFDAGPVFSGLFDGRCGRMLIVGEGDIQFFKYPVETGIAVHVFFEDKIRKNVGNFFA